jgi:hypothetical protein
MKRYGRGHPIVAVQMAAGSGRVRDLGTVAIAGQGRVPSTTEAFLVRAQAAMCHRGTV